MGVDTPKLLRCNNKTQNPGMKKVLPTDQLHRGSALATSVTFAAQPEDLCQRARVRELASNRQDPGRLRRHAVQPIPNLKELRNSRVSRQLEGSK
jgi:hypothetical protein